MRDLMAMTAAMGLLLGAAACAEDDAQARAKALIHALGSDDFAARQAAQKELAAMGKAIEPLLREAAGTATDSEVKSRLEALLEEFTWGDAVNGLRMRVTAPSEVALGKEFVLKVLIQNVSDKEQSFGDWVPYDVSLYMVGVVDKATGAVVHWEDQPRGYDKHFVGSNPIAPGGTHEVPILLHEGAFTPALAAGQSLEIRVAYEMSAGTLGFPGDGWGGKMASGPIVVRVSK